jgi:glycosyltransferase involved in cell wall biosynthesis
MLFFERWILKNAKSVHFLGKSEAEHIDSIIRLNNKTVIPNGQDMDELAFEYAQLVKKKQPVFGFCGRMDMYYKGLDMLLEAFIKYKQKNGQGTLWLIGEGNDQSCLNEQVRKANMHEHVIFYGKKFGEEKLNIIANMDVFVHPSRSEGSPTAVLEAAGLGIPCIISTATNVGEIMEKNEAGVHIKENNPEKIMQALFHAEEMFFAGELKPMGERAAQAVKNEFNWKAIAKRLIEIYQ